MPLSHGRTSDVASPKSCQPDVPISCEIKGSASAFGGQNIFQNSSIFLRVALATTVLPTAMGDNHETSPISTFRGRRRCAAKRP